MREQQQNIKPGQIKPATRHYSPEVSLYVRKASQQRKPGADFCQIVSQRLRFSLRQAGEEIISHFNAPR